jgi:cell pole-organizing protein PopZ
MGDISAEPSMEDILSSIKRIIAEEGDVSAGRMRRPTRAAGGRPLPLTQPREVLELSDAVDYDDEDEAEEPMPAMKPKISAPEPAPVQFADALAQARQETSQQETSRREAPQEMPKQQTPEAAPAEPLLSRGAESATRGPLDALSRLVVKPEVSGSDTLEGMVRDMLKPMLREWLDSHLPAMVEQMVAKEIARITSQGR